ncbi:MAG: serine/threonine protein kinase [Waterburya sp.]
MSIKFTKLSKILVIATIASLLSLEAKAEIDSLPEAFEDAYFKKGKNAFEQSSILGQLDAAFGFTGFPEQHISADGEAVDNVYQAGLKRQSANAIRFMTRDLENPYETSLKENPSYTAVEGNP